MQKRWLGLILPLVFGLTACSERPRTSRSQPLVLEGRPAEAAPFAAVALLRRDSAQEWFAFCSGVLLAPTEVVTAAHCSVDSDGTLHQPEAVLVVAGDSRPEAPGARRLVVQSIAVLPGFDGKAMGRQPDGLIRPAAARDLAVWTLAQPVTAPVAVLLQTSAGEEFLRDGEAITITGFGQRDPWESPWASHEFAVAQTPFRLRVTLAARERVRIDGRAELRTISHDVAGLTAGEFYAGGTLRPDTCKGDSGSGAFVTAADGSLRLVGITSRGTARCGDGGVYTFVPAFTDWLSGKIPGLRLERRAGLVN